MSKIDEIAQALTKAQEIEPTEAERLATDVARNRVALVVAEYWMSSKDFPVEPDVGGLTPLALSKNVRPSQVLSMVLWLQTDPGKALEWVHGALARKARLKSNTSHPSKND